MTAKLPLSFLELARITTGIFIILCVLNFHIAIAFLVVLGVYRVFDASKKSIVSISILGALALIGWDFYAADNIIYAILVPVANWYYFFHVYYAPDFVDFSSIPDIVTTLWRVSTDDQFWEAFPVFIKGMFSGETLSSSYLSSVVGWAVIPSGIMAYQWKKTINIKAYHSGESEKVDEAGKKTRLNKKTATKSGFILGSDARGRDVILTDKNANTHTLVVGTTGAGKTNTLSVLVEGALEKKWPIIFVDGKGVENLGQAMVSHAQKFGREVSYFSMNRGSNFYYNPLIAGDYTSKKDRIITLFDDQNEYYKSISEGYIQYVFEVLEKCGVTTDMYQASQYMQKEALLKLIRKAVSEGFLDQSEAQNLSDGMKKHEAAQKDISSVATHINNICGSSSGAFFNTEGEGKEIITIPDILENNGFVYFKLPYMKSESFVDIFGKLIINDIKASLHDRLEEGKIKPVLIVLDEYSAFAGEQVSSLLSQGRSTGARCVIGTQGFADFKKGVEGERLLSRLVQNINNFIIQQLGGYEDREVAAKLSGSKSTRKLTTQIGGDNSTLLGSLRDAYEWNINPADFDKLKSNGDAYFFSFNDKGQKERTRFQIRLSKITIAMEKKNVSE